jgi:hypothetical protein
MDLQGAFDWSEGIEAGLGSRFLFNVDRIVETLESQPFVFPVFYREVRRAVVFTRPTSCFTFPPSPGWSSLPVSAATATLDGFGER